MRLRLDLRAFDDAEFKSYLRRCRESGIDITTVAEVGDTGACRRALYEFHKTCSADVPGLGEFCTFDEYLARLEPPGYDPRGVVLAVSDGEWVGMAFTSLRQEEDCAVSDMTGVLPSYRGVEFPWQ